MRSLIASDFSLKSTLESGQIFRYYSSDSSRNSRDESFYYVVAGDSIIKIRQKGSVLEYSCSNSNFDVVKFLGLNHSYSKILSSISRDKRITAAIKKHHGLRILEQQPWECTASFIISAFSNIPRIRQCVEKVAASFGSRTEFEGFKTFSFPQPQQINSFSKLNKCGLGYRAKYLFETAKIFSGGSDDYSQRQLRKLSYSDAKKKIMRLPGVGEKVADCILLFSCGFFEAFPVDVWIHRAMLGSYGSGIKEFAAAANSKAKKPNEKVVGDFARSYFGEYAGYAQQFIYHDERERG